MPASPVGDSVNASRNSLLQKITLAETMKKSGSTGYAKTSRRKNIGGMFEEAFAAPILHSAT
jgi:hypothetical protein